jgi:hypothetical protein
MTISQERVNTHTALQPRIWRRFFFHRLDSNERRPRIWAAILGGAGLGFLWGIAARIWMWLIARNPVFSMEGTAIILIIGTFFGIGTGLAFAARRRGWRGWRHYLPRTLGVIFFVFFGFGGGLPLMLTVLLATLSLYQSVLVGIWTTAMLTALVVLSTRIDAPTFVVIIALVYAAGVTVWKWAGARRGGDTFVRIDRWVDYGARVLLLLLALAGFGSVVQEILHAKSWLLTVIYSFLYLLLLSPVFLGLRVSLKPRDSIAHKEAQNS